MFKWLNLNKSTIEQYYSTAFKAQDLFKKKINKSVLSYGKSW